MMEPMLRGRPYCFLVAFVAAVGGFLFGYDLTVMGGANVYLRDQFAMSDSVFGFTTASATIGCVIGPMFAGWMCDRYGRRSTLLIACALLGAGSVLTALPRSLVVFNLFRIVGGIGVGLCSVASPMYTNELAPPRFRGGLGFMYQLAIVVGAVAAAAVTWRLAKSLPADVGWRWMFGSELLFVVLFAGLLTWIPESPRWLAERGRTEAAEAVLSRIEGSEFAQAEIAMIRQSVAAESGSFRELLEPGLRKALLVGLGLAFFNNYTGWTAISGYLARLFELGGFGRTDAIYEFTLAYGFMAVLTLGACFLVDRVGRRPLWLISSLIMIAANTLLGLIFFRHLSGFVVLWAVFLCAVPHAFALGPLPWLMMSEIFPTRVRAKAVAITTSFIWTVNFAATSLFPLIAGWSEAKIGSISGVFWLSGAVCVLALVFGLAWLPETKGKSLEAIAASWNVKR
jgi:SP family arabinose:H+ symporter-like MFS transporter